MSVELRTLKDSKVMETWYLAWRYHTEPAKTCDIGCFIVRCTNLLLGVDQTRGMENYAQTDASSKKLHYSNPE